MSPPSQVLGTPTTISQQLILVLQQYTRFTEQLNYLFRWTTNLMRRLGHAEPAHSQWILPHSRRFIQNICLMSIISYLVYMQTKLRNSLSCFLEDMHNSKFRKLSIIYSVCFSLLGTVCHQRRRPSEERRDGKAQNQPVWCSNIKKSPTCFQQCHTSVKREA